MPAECINRLCLGSSPQASGKTALTAFQKLISKRYMEAKSGPSRMLALKGANAPRGLLMLLRIIVMTAVSVTIASELALSDGRFISLKNGELASRFRRLQISEGTLLA